MLSSLRKYCIKGCASHNNSVQAEGCDWSYAPTSTSWAKHWRNFRVNELQESDFLKNTALGKESLAAFVLSPDSRAEFSDWLTSGTCTSGSLLSHRLQCRDEPPWLWKLSHFPSLPILPWALTSFLQDPEVYQISWVKVATQCFYRSI